MIINKIRENPIGFLTTSNRYKWDTKKNRRLEGKPRLTLYQTYIISTENATFFCGFCANPCDLLHITQPGAAHGGIHETNAVCLTKSSRCAASDRKLSSNCILAARIIKYERAGENNDLEIKNIDEFGQICARSQYFA